jgi:copper transport protein
MSRPVRVGLLLAGLAGLVPVSPVMGHAQLLSSSPGAGVTVASAPDELELVFSEAVDPAFASIRLTAEDSGAVDVGSTEVDPGDGHRVTATVPVLVDGVYTVLWQVLSAADGHVTSGSFQFGVGDAVPAPGRSGSRPGDLHAGQPLWLAVADVLGRSASYGGLLLAVGLFLVVGTVVRPSAGTWPPGAARLGAAALALAMAGTILVIGVGLISVNAVAPTDPVTYLTTSRSGVLLGARVIVTGVAAAVVALSLRRRPNQALALASLAGAVGVLLTAFVSHADAAGGLGPVAAVVAHMFAAGVWLAGIVTLVLIGAGRLGSRRSDLRAVVPRFSALALVAVGFVVATGVYATWLQVGSLPGLQTPYGRVLIAKIVAAAIAVGFGAINYFDGGRGRPIGSGLGRRVAAEVGLAVAVIVLTANLTGSAPPRGEPLVTVPPVAGADALDGLELAFQDLPPGPNRAVVTIPPPPLHVGTVELDLDRLDATGESSRTVLGNDPQGPHGFRFSGPVILPASSQWSATVIGHDVDGVELWRGRFAFSMSTTGLDLEPGLKVNLGIIVAVAVLLVALAGIGYWIGGGGLPRTDAQVGRTALMVGAVLGLVLAAALLLWPPVT